MALTKHRVNHLWVASILAACAAAAVRAEGDPARDFDTLFGAEMRKVQGTADTADDVALAKTLVAACRTTNDRPVLVAYMLEKAYDLAFKDATGAGSPVAIEAMTVLSEKDAAKKAAAQAKVLNVLQRDYLRAKPADQPAAGQALVDKLIELGDAAAAGNEFAAALAHFNKALPIAIRIKSPLEPALRSKVQGTTQRQRVEQQIGNLQEKFLKDPNDAASVHDLVMLYVVELDKPAATAMYVKYVTDEETKKNLPLTLKEPTDLQEADFLSLGAWYEGLVKRAVWSGSKRAMLVRAQGYYEAYMTAHQAADISRLQADVSVKRVAAAIKDLDKELGPVASAKPAGPAEFTFTGKTLAIEAEKASIIEAPMKAEPGRGASGGQYVWRPGEIGKRNGDGPGHLVFYIKASEAADVYIWGRVKAPDEANNSFYVGIETGQTTTPKNRKDWRLPNDAKDWTWAPYTENDRIRRLQDLAERFGAGRFPGGRGPGGPGRNDNEPQPTSIHLSAGMNSLIITPREHGAMLDGIIISKSPNKPE